ESVKKFIDDDGEKLGVSGFKTYQGGHNYCCWQGLISESLMPKAPVDSLEFKQSIVEHAVASGRDANCFFQSFFHTLTSQPADVINEIKIKYPDSIKALVDTFNTQLSLEPLVDFDKIIDISKKLHPLERECVFGPILRHTYNTMLKRELLTGDRE